MHESAFLLDDPNEMEVGSAAAANDRIQLRNENGDGSAGADLVGQQELPGIPHSFGDVAKIFSVGRGGGGVKGAGSERKETVSFLL